MSNIDELRLFSIDKPTVFTDTYKYIVPLYQRAYSWTFKEIEQLIDDLSDFNDDEYYLGSLIVYKRNDAYEVIDGQQRLTTLYILFDVLKYMFNCNCENYKSLIFECREKSNHTLQKYYEKDLDETLIEKTIIDGKDIIFQKIKRDKIDVDALINRFSNIILYRIEVPEHTDLNRYFEIMNTRGEQLEQTDILKARLMEPLTENEKDAFAILWDACSDMTGYVQMHIDSKSKIRSLLFDNHWNYLKEDSLDDFLLNRNAKNVQSNITIKEAILNDYSTEDYDGIDDKDERVRFDSIIEYPYFLQHVLKVYVDLYDIFSCDEKDIVPEQIDDKKLLINFKRVIQDGLINNQRIDKRTFSINFIKCLIKCRYLFDKYIIKREHSVDDKDGEWCIKSLYSYDGKASYSNTRFKLYEQNKAYTARNRMNVMIQSCLRVSYISAKTMHWITSLLKELYKRQWESISNLHIVAENFAKKAVETDFLDLCDSEYSMGVDTPHIVFNYLDYLIWKKDKMQYSDFVFEFRNSVEHWYPQHPSDGTFPKWEDGVDTFGNLCIIQRNVNSKFSNLAPEAKKSTYKDMISKGSLKLREMARITNSSTEWKDKYCQKHEEEMINLLKESIYPNNA